MNALAQHRQRVEASEFALMKDVREARDLAKSILRKLDRLPAIVAHEAVSTFVHVWNHTWAPDRLTNARCIAAGKKALRCVSRLDNFERQRFTKRILGELERYRR